MNFSEISLLSRLRYGLFAFVSVRRERWDAIETESARSWITRWCGTESVRTTLETVVRSEVLSICGRRPCSLDLDANQTNRAFSQIDDARGAGIHRGRKSTLVDSLCSAIVKGGGRIRTKCPAQRVIVEDGRVTGILTPEGVVRADAVISTVPTL